VALGLSFRVADGGKMRRMPYGLLLIRVVFGLTMAAHGSQKLFGWFGGGGPQGTAEMLGKLRFRPARPMAVLVALGELSGLAFAFGLVTPLAALAIATVMLTAVATVHWKNGFFAGNGGYELNLCILAAAVGIAATGPGRFSLDRLIGWDGSISGLWWGVGVLGAAAFASLLTLTVGRHRPAPAKPSELRRAA
jgi:putative oxidoreductase